MSLLDEARLWLRVSSDDFDDEILGLIQEAICDLRRVGVREDMLDEDMPAPLVRSAVRLYLKANFGYDNPERPQFEDAYARTMANLLNSCANECGWGS